MIVHECEQLSPEWFELHRGVPTASDFDRILTPKTMKLSASAQGFIHEKIAEVYHIGPLVDLGIRPTKAMMNGIEVEPEARRWYEMEYGQAVEQVGFVTTDDGRFGSSPDGFVLGICPTCKGMGADGGSTGPDPEAPWTCPHCDGKGTFREGVLELKCPGGKAHVAWLLEGVLPADHKAQTHGHILVSSLPWCGFLSYCPGLPPLSLRIEQDSYTEKLAMALEEFWGLYQAALAKIAEM